MLRRFSWMGRVNGHAAPYLCCAGFASSAAADCPRLERTRVNDSTKRPCRDHRSALQVQAKGFHTLGSENGGKYGVVW